MEKTADDQVAAGHRANSVGLAATADPERIEAPVTWKAYLMCAFASFGGIFFGYDSGYINGVTGSAVFIRLVEGDAFVDAQIAAGDSPALTGSNLSLITSILSADSCASKSLDHAAIDVALHRFPFSLVWSPIPILTWFLPFVGHLGIADSKG